MLVRRTDLALEAAELTAAKDLPGVRREERVTDGIRLTVVEVTDPEAAELLGKPVGRYVTLDLRDLRRREPGSFRRSAEVLAAELAKFIPQGDGPVLVVCLGNRRVTADAIGPRVQELLLVTRHLIEQMPEGFGAFESVAAIAPGVLASTGVESGELTAAVVERVKPRCVVAVDALAAQSVGRLCETVQLSGAGIAPGSGVGNHRQALDRDTLGVPVIALGIPTVVDGATLCADILRETGREDVEPEALAGKGSGLYVTPRDIDQRVEEGAKLIAWGLNLALQPGLSLEDLEMLVE